MASELDAAGNAFSRDPETRRFFSLLLVATAIPFVLFPLIAHAFPASAGWNDAKGFLLFVGSSGHVAASFFFYGDARMRDFMLGGHRGRFLVAPLTLIGLMGLAGLLFAEERLLSYVILGYWVWQTHHYTRQNHGILAFVSRAAGVRASLRESLAITLTGVAAVVGMITYVTPYQNTALDLYGWQLHTLAVALYASAWVVYGITLFERNPLSAPWRSAVLLALMLFYLPLFLFQDLLSAVFTYAIAHGLQYLVFMGVVAAVPTARRVRSYALLAGVTLAGGAVLWLSQQQAFWGSYGKAVYGMGLGVVMWHFLLDAGVWRLSESFQRGYMAERFSFLRSPR